MATDDQIRFSNLVLPYLAAGFALARWITRSTADAEDVVQEACLRAFRGFNGYAGGNPRAWFLAIVRNTAYTHLRKNNATGTIDIDTFESLEGVGAAGIDPAQAAQAETPETVLMQKVDALRLQEAMMALPLEYRETLVLREVHGLGYREIASVTGKPVGTVMSRLARGRRRLIAALDGGDG